MCGINLIFQINKTIDYNNTIGTLSKLPKKENTFNISIALAKEKEILFIFLLNSKNLLKNFFLAESISSR
jgi:hypothetical protein